MNAPRDPLVPAEPSSIREGNGRFPVTHWTMVLAAQEKDAARAEQAMQALFTIYWYPVYSFLRRNFLLSPHDAEDLTQGFFASLLDYQTLLKADPDKGRFRSFLLRALKSFRINDWNAAQTQKRGGGQQVGSFDVLLAEETFGCEPANLLTPDKLYDRQFASALLERARTRLEKTFAESGKGAVFSILWDAMTIKDAPQAEFAATAKMSETAFKVALHRMREVYRALLREEVGQTVGSPAEIDPEIRHLFASLGG